MEEIRIEHWEVLIRGAASGHVGTGGSAHRFGVILVLETQSHFKRSRREIRHIACGVDVGLARLQQLVDNDAIAPSTRYVNLD